MRPVICTLKNHSKGIRSKGEISDSKKRIPKSLKRRTIRQYNGISVLIAQVQVYCSCSRKESVNTKTVVTPQAYLLQPAVIMKRRKKHVLCVRRVLYNPAMFWHKMHLIVRPQENSIIYRKLKAIKCRQSDIRRPGKTKLWTTPV